MLDCGETKEKPLSTPTFETLVHNGDGNDRDKSKADIRSLYKDTVLAGRKAYDAFHEVIEALEKDRSKDDTWEENIGTAAILVKDGMVSTLDEFAMDSKVVIRLVEGEKPCVESAAWFIYCVDGWVLLSRKVNEALELVYESRKGGQQRI